MIFSIPKNVFVTHVYRLVQAIFWLPGYLQENQERLYQRVEQRSRIASDDKMKQVMDDQVCDLAGTKQLDASGEKATIMEEKGENDAVECEGDNKKDK